MSIYNGFCGPSNPSQSVLADCERLMNWYVERSQAQFSPTGAALYPTPGQIARYTLTDVGARAIFSMAMPSARCFAVVGGGVWELFADLTSIRRGTVAQDANPATISYNGITGGQLGITSGGNWYNYNLSTNVLTQVAALNSKATQGGMKDGYFLCFDINTSTVYVSALNDGTTWTVGTMYFQRTIAPDPWKAMVVGNPLIYMIGEQTAEAWYDAGNTPQPFAPILSSFMNYGTSAPFSVALNGANLAWVSRTKDGSDQVVVARGYDVTPISNYAVSTALSTFRRSTTLDDAEVIVYEEDGHTFAAFNFFQAKSTWAVDLETGEWHERGTWVPAQNAYDAWHPRVHGYAFGRHLVGDRSTGVISELTINSALEPDGVTGIRRLRIGPPLWAANTQRLCVSRLQVQADVGLGLVAGQGSDPQMMLRTTEDAHTWSSSRMCSAGRLGQYRRKVFWTRCGSSEKIWAPEITVSDPIPWRLSAAEIEGEGLNQMGRAA